MVTGQGAALAAGDRHLMETFGTDVTEVVCVVAGAAGVCSFPLLYVRHRGTGDQDDGQDDDRSVWD
ncbi:hypothetical protein [Streptomyces sp. NPDC017940]|uniref:hypothetical protein n=1 Tax=Streptomyces sp. NPDC017940 TaxID=3365017 RepID=UPI0037ACD835